jgi:hypothetical protein
MYLGCREYTKRIVVGNSGKQLLEDENKDDGNIKKNIKKNVL